MASDTDFDSDSDTSSDFELYDPRKYTEDYEKEFDREKRDAILDFMEDNLIDIAYTPVRGSRDDNWVGNADALQTGQQIHYILTLDADFRQDPSLRDDLIKRIANRTLPYIPENHITAIETALRYLVRENPPEFRPRYVPPAIIPPVAHLQWYYTITTLFPTYNYLLQGLGTFWDLVAGNTEVEDFPTTHISVGSSRFIKPGWGIDKIEWVLLEMDDRDIDDEIAGEFVELVSMVGARVLIERYQEEDIQYEITSNLSEVFNQIDWGYPDNAAELSFVLQNAFPWFQSDDKEN